MTSNAISLGSNQFGFRSRSKNFARRIYTFINSMGMNPLQFVSFMLQFPAFMSEYFAIKRELRNSNHGFKSVLFFPCLADRFAQSGEAEGHYFHQDLLVASKIFENNPKVHLDVGSRIDGFVAHVAAFREIHVIDIRPLRSKANRIQFMQADLMQAVPEHLRGFSDSLSCLHALEHFGLGRYGDPKNLDGHLVGLKNLASLLKRGGKFYLSVPIGPQRIEFNAHRVFDVAYILDVTREDFVFNGFSYVDDRGELHREVSLQGPELARNFGCWYGCGIFEMTRK